MVVKRYAKKTPDFDSKLRPYKTIYKQFLWQSKGMQKTPDFDANSKAMQKTPDLTQN